MILCQWLGVEPCRSVGEELVFNSTGTLNTHFTYLHAAVAVARQIMSTDAQLPPSIDTASPPQQQAADPALAEAEPQYWTARQAEAALGTERRLCMDSSRTGNVIRNSLGRCHGHDLFTVTSRLSPHPIFINDCC